VSPRHSERTPRFRDLEGLRAAAAKVGRFVSVWPGRNLAIPRRLSLTVMLVALGLGMASASPTVASTPSSAPVAVQATASDTIAAALADSSGGVTADNLPKTVDRAVPTNLQPALAHASGSLPPPYFDGCHLNASQVVSPSCTYGKVTGTHTVVLFGDSHAAQWWPAIQKLSLQQGWKFVSYTKTACRPIEIGQFNPDLKSLYTACTTWVKNTLPRIAALHPDLVVVGEADTVRIARPDGTPYSIADTPVAFGLALTTTLETLSHSASHVVMMGDEPYSTFDVLPCISAHLTSILACSTPYSQAIRPSWRTAVKKAAQAAGTGYIDPTFWVCVSSPCPPIVGDYLLYRNPSHLTKLFVATLAGRLSAKLPGL